MSRDVFVGLRAEDKSYWERRTPMPPCTCKEIMDKHPRIQILVQSSSKRIFSDLEYEQAGCIIQQDLNKCAIIVCIKEIPLDKYIPGMTYIHWAHVMKAQEYNMEALDKTLELKIRQFDYERIYDEKGVNITAFPYAGIAGIITFLSEYGKWLLQREINNQFLYIGPSYQYHNLEMAYQHLREVGALIKSNGLSPSIGLPLTIGILGSTGKCGAGSMEALMNLPITIVKPSQLQEIMENPNDPKHRYTIYVIPFETKDLVRCSKDYDRVFSSKEYYENPNEFTPVFHSKYLPYLSLLVNDIYWDHKFPRYITNTQMKQLVQSGKSRLQAVSDVTCDFEGSIQFLKKFTSPENPVYFYNPIEETITDDWKQEQPQIMYMSIDFLPSQIPYDASIHFGKVLVDIIPEIAYSDATKSLEESGLSLQLQTAVITIHGKLAPNFEYIHKLRKVKEDLKHRQHFQPQKALKKTPSYISIKIEGHLFDKGAINRILDALEEKEINFNMVDIKSGNREDETSTATIQLFSKVPGALQDAIAKIIEIAEAHDCKFVVC